MIDGFYMILIMLLFSKFVFIVGESFMIQCIIDSNLLFIFKWYFWFDGIFVERFMGFIENKLEFDSF